jgi:hypothetical protein
MKKARKTPVAFASGAEERAYREREDSTEHDRDLAQTAGEPFEAIKIAAHKCDVPYQSLIKMWLSEKVR